MRRIEWLSVARLLGLLICAGGTELAGGTETTAADKYVNGYTYIAPSYYLTPPVVVTGPYYPAPYFPSPVPVAPYYPPPIPPAPYDAAVIPGPVYPAPVYSTPGPAPSPVISYPTMSYDPTWPYASPGLPGGSYRERIIQRPREVEYRVKTYSPTGRPQAKYEVEYNRRGVEIKTRQR